MQSISSIRYVEQTVNNVMTEVMYSNDMYFFVYRNIQEILNKFGNDISVTRDSEGIHTMDAHKLFYYYICNSSLRSVAYKGFINLMSYNNSPLQMSGLEGNRPSQCIYQNYIVSVYTDNIVNVLNVE